MNLRGIVSVGFGLCLAFSASGQPPDYEYQRTLIDAKGPWCRVELPNDIFAKLGPLTSDLRILGETAEGDTVEAAFLLRIMKETGRITNSSLTIRNQSSNDRGYFYTLEMTSPALANTLDLGFGTDDFDWRIRLEGSTNEHEWFTLVDNYRILSIQNPTSPFKFTRVVFPPARYPLYRLLVKTAVDPVLTHVTVSQVIHDDGRYRSYASRITTVEDGKSGRTNLDIKLSQCVPVSRIALHVKDTFDHYRPLEILYLADSFQMNGGWTANYASAASEVINSLERPRFDFSPVLTQRLSLVIVDDHNEPLTVDSVSVSGPVYELIVRIIRPGDYTLYYGSRLTSLPHYDIENFPDRIPSDAPTATLGPEQKAGHLASEPVFTKYWLWGLMILIIAVLGWFTMKMIRQQS